MTKLLIASAFLAFAMPALAAGSNLAGQPVLSQQGHMIGTISVHYCEYQRTGKCRYDNPNCNVWRHHRCITHLRASAGWKRDDSVDERGSTGAYALCDCTLRPAKHCVWLGRTAGVASLWGGARRSAPLRPLACPERGFARLVVEEPEP